MAATWLSYQVALGSMDVAKIQDFKAVIAGIVPDNKQLEMQLVTAVEARAKEIPESIKATLRAGGLVVHVVENNTEFLAGVDDKTLFFLPIVA